MNLRSFLFVFGCFASFFANARLATEGETKHIAEQWLRANRHIMKASGEMTISELKSASGELIVRKVLLTSGEALFVAADTRLQPVLAALPRGWIRATHPMVRHLIADVEARLREAPQENHPAWAALLAETPLMPAQSPLYVFDEARWVGELDHWNQESFNRYGRWEEGTLYNRYTPERYMVGCVAIAGSVIQQFYAFPSEQDAYTNSFCAVYGADMRPQFRPLQTRPGAYRWEILPKTWQKPQTLTEEQMELLARIAANSGVITGTHYAAAASGGSTYFLMEGLRKGAGYATGMEYCPSPQTKMAEFLAGTLYSQLRAGAPCVLDLGGKAGNHAVVAVGVAEDAQRTIYTRIFFGWGGSGDVWYALPEKGSFHSILGIGTLVSTKGAFVPIIGQLLRADGTPAAAHSVTIAEQQVKTDASGYFAVRICPMDEVNVQAGEVSATVTMDAALLQRAAVEPWAEENPKAVTTDALLKALPRPLTLRLP